jgi:putative ABC transport system substrate-binding protein
MTLTITRREVAAAIGGAAAWPIRARGQQPIPVIGYLGSNEANRLRAFHQGLNEAGYAEGRNVLIDYRWTVIEDEQSVAAMAAELVRSQVNVIAANGPATRIAKAATTKIPIIF